MKKVILSLSVFSMVFLASCNNKPKEENVEGTEKEVTELPVGEAKMEAAAKQPYRQHLVEREQLA